MYALLQSHIGLGRPLITETRLIIEETSCKREVETTVDIT